MKSIRDLLFRVEIPLAKANRKITEFPHKEFSLQGMLLLSSAKDAQEKQHILQTKLPLPDQTYISAGDFYGAALLHSVFQFILDKYTMEQGLHFWHDVEKELQGDSKEKDELFQLILDEHPTNEIFTKRVESQELISKDEWRVHAMQQMILLRLFHENPALEKLTSWVSTTRWEENSTYKRMMDSMEKIMESRPNAMGEGGDLLMDLLRAPLKHSDDLQEQLKYIRDRWGLWLEELLALLLGGLDLLSEENQIRLPGPGPAQGVDFTLLEDDQARYSPDSGWMPKVILLAKNALVWLFQLSKQYQRPINTLSDIPDEELDFLASCGFTGLWLIGLWERSPASQHIKKLCGNPEAEASAYSLYHYYISHRLGGEQAMENLKERCRIRGIRMASDMVPNHCGIDSDWVRHHPDWFIGRPDNPYPQYTYNGPNLSEDPSMEVYLEDHYYNQTDCAVTFKRVDKNTGETQYIYHGNDGTSMPWNDTAQIDFLNPQAREEVIQQILQVARHFPIIRFDAAMVLARRHIRRLWYPKPGEGGAIPSRSQSAMSDLDFHNAIPEEFWREVVQRVAQECPDTLLLAEAFWMMEGYFVRNLGMHRVYNSAFMNMVKDEKNDEFRELIKKTLDYDPEILKRFVNFMSNPDEDTAEAQFGRGDKYFGALALMLTLPGLPMIGHGQLEGYREKYGMEYSRAYYDEEPDAYLMERHAKEIYPIMKQRKLFAEAAMFHLYDVADNHGGVQEDVYAYSNRYDGKNSLFLFNNRFEEAQGNIHISYSKGYNLASLLGLSNHPSHYAIFHEHHCNLWFIRNSAELYEKGLFFHTHGYGYQLFTQFREIQDGPDRLYQAICKDLQGRGTPSMNQAIKDYRLKPLYKVLISVFNPENLQLLGQALMNRELSLPAPLKDGKVLNAWLSRLKTKLGKNPARGLKAWGLKRMLRRSLRRWRYISSLHHLPGEMQNAPETAQLLGLWLMLQPLKQISGKTGEELIEQWDIITQLLQRRQDQEKPWLPFNGHNLLKSFFRLRDWHKEGDLSAQLSRLFDDPLFQSICGVNMYDNVLWFNQQGFEEITGWLFILARIEQRNIPLFGWVKSHRLWNCYNSWMAKYRESGFRVQHMRTHHK